MAGLIGARRLALAASLGLAACTATAAPTDGAGRALAVYRGLRERAATLPGSAKAAARELTVDQAVALAKQRSAALARSDAKAAAAAARTAAAGALRNPELRLSQLRLDQLLDGTPRLSAGVRVRPPRPGQAEAEVAEARADETAARAALRAEELAIEAEIRWRFDEVRLLDAEIEAMAAAAATRRRLAALLAARLDASQATALDEAAAALSAVEAEESSAEQRALREVALGALLDRLGLTPATPLRLVGEPIVPSPLPELPPEAALVEAALRGRPDIAIAAARLDAAGARGAIERGKRWPWPTFVQLGYELTPGTRDPLGWTLQTGLELPLFDTRRSAALAADAELAEAQRAFSAEVEQVARSVRERLREVRAAAALLEAWRSRVLPAAERAGAEAARALDSGQIDLLRALSLEERRAAAAVRHLRLVRRYRTALAELRRAVGGGLAGLNGAPPRPSPEERRPADGAAR